jgi:hypothetical protein
MDPVGSETISQIRIRNEFKIKLHRKTGKLLTFLNKMLNQKI